MGQAQPNCSGNKVILGIFQALPLQRVSRYLARQGWDWIILDMQHSSFDFETAYECIHTICDAGLRPLVRVPIGDYTTIQRALDLGARGIVVPMVNSRTDAEKAARAGKYPPLGNRSVGGDFRYHTGADHVCRSNAETHLLVQIEHIDAVHSADEIFAVEGVDGCLMGPTDLALSMGLPEVGFENDPGHRDAIQRALDSCRAAEKLPCINAYNLIEAGERARQGFHCITLRCEVDMFMDAGKTLLADLRRKVGEARHVG
jgi:4-hydroxy-2-oxoheptanedioate aldolase